MAGKQHSPNPSALQSAVQTVIANIQGASHSADARMMRNAAQTLLANIEFASVDKPIQSIAVTSTMPSEGKTTIAIELAAAAAASGARVLLVDADMRRRSIGAALGVHPGKGVYACLAKKASLPDCVVALRENLWFLDTEPGIPNPPAVFRSERFAALHASLCRSFDYVIFDTPPIGAFVDAAVLASLVDATVLVVRERTAKRSAVRDTYDQLASAGANVVGVVMNGCRIEKSEYSRYYEESGTPRRSAPSGKGSSASQRPAPQHSRG